MKTVRLAAIIVAVAWWTACASSPATSAEGVVLSVDGDLVTVRAFVLRADDGANLDLHVDGGRDYGYPLPHLQEHVVTGERVYVEWEERNGRLVLTFIDDADRDHGGGLDF